jgi:hypothetical protein
MKPPLLVFRLYNIAKNAYWHGAHTVPLPEGSAAIAVSGGLADLWERRQGKTSQPDGSGHNYILTPFLHSAPSWVMTRIVWALLGPGGRFHPIYRTSCAALRNRGFTSPDLPNIKSDLLVSLKLSSNNALDVDWASDFTTCFSSGLGVGFWGESTKLEQKLKRAETFSVFRQKAESVLESFDQRMEDAHPYLWANWQENGFE